MNSVNPGTEFSNTNLRFIKNSEPGILICSFRIHLSGISYS